MSDRYEIRVAGSGGQGVILAAVIIGQSAALMEEGLNAVQTQAYGPEARGGASKSEVIIARGEIDYPKAANPNLQVILTQKACDEYAHDTAEGGTVILDDFFVREDPKLNAEIYRLPIVKTARDVLGREIVTNMVALGTVARVLEAKGMVRPESIRSTILANVPKGTEELNSKAFDEGYRLMKEKV
ncbi:MAG: 2-oxoacid:acceptor oxidoreductase family protein [Synergistaceae bacterium]|jgi:2-oxoglutarate ferredoxin oxidoreductase subunit gamma|nr:2-oxoacid:acceptor oxidoreductase family protein [Synergistaceae bacterium]